MGSRDAPRWRSGIGAVAMAQPSASDPAQEQQRLARARVAAAGFGHRVEIDLGNYRDVDGQYDSAVSVEMIEAVGYRSYGTSPRL